MSDIPENNKREENNIAMTEQENLHKEEITDDTAEEVSNENEGEEEEHDEVDYSHFSRKDLVSEVESQLKNEKIRQADRIANETKSYFDELEEADKQEALQKFLETGGEESDFEYRPDTLSERFYQAYRQLKERKSKFYDDLNKERSQNLAAKQDVLNRLRELVDSEETQVSINTLKDLQKEWRSTGQVPPQYARNLWANYNALINRFYDNRSIYFELKELDRKKNLEAKQELCGKAESLTEVADMRDAIRQLDELHEEYKHIGPVPQEEQEELWQRFKTASDKIHDRRRTSVDEFKKELHQNLEEKLKLCEEVLSFSEFQSESIKEWNQKTKEIQDLQKRWEKIGSMPRERARDINKKFWSGFKQFFAHKGEFFKRLDEKREDNLKKKEELVAKADNLKESDDWQKTANELKKLQQEWKNIGPVPERVREEIYQRFKAACDLFFERRRSKNKTIDSEYEQNLKAKKEICEQIEKISLQGEEDTEKLLDLSEQYAEIGFVPKNAIRSISQRFEEAIEKLLSQAETLDEQQKQELKIETEFLAMKNNPGVERKMNNRENHLRKKISHLEEDISLWKNNITFFASSKNADKLKAEFEDKIEKATAQLEELKTQLNIIQNIR